MSRVPYPFLFPPDPHSLPVSLPNRSGCRWEGTFWVELQRSFAMFKRSQMANASKQKSERGQVCMEISIDGDEEARGLLPGDLSSLDLSLGTPFSRYKLPSLHFLQT